MLLKVNDRTSNDQPSRLVMNMRSGEVTAMNVHENYVPNDHGFFVRMHSVVPFRLTRNIRSFMTEFYEKGSFEFSVGAYALVRVATSVDI